jgi:hypothetical protein
MRNTAVLPLSFLSVVALALAAGCANGNIATAGGAPAPAPSPTQSCSALFASQLPNEAVRMVFPQNGALNAPNIQGVVIAVSPAPLPTNWYFYSSSTIYGSTYGTQSIGFFATPAPASTSASPSPTPTPLPTPSDTPPFPNPIYEWASNGTFAVSVPSAAPNHVTIYLANPSCYPGIAMSSFTTATYDVPSPTPSPSPT